MGTVTRTVVFTDLVNYTAKVAGTDREGLRKVLQDHEDLVRPIVERFGGRIVKNLGDSFMALFLSATDGLKAALEIQHTVSTTHPDIRIRLAMQTGDVEEIEGDAFGEAVNIAARIIAQNKGEEIWFGPGTRVCMNSAEIPWESVGQFRLKGIPGEKTIYRAVPRHTCWLPEQITTAVKSGNLVRLRQGARPPLLPPDPVVLLEGFEPNSPELSAVVDNLPVLNPSSLWLAAYNIGSVERATWTEAGRGFVIGTPESIDRAVREALKVITRASGSDTIVLDGGVQADLELVRCGLALPAVPLSDVVASYHYDLLPDGRWENRSENAILRVDVTAQGTRLQALSPSVMLNGRSVPAGDGVLMQHGDQIHTANGTFTFHRADQGYAGLILADSEMRMGVMSGQTVQLGREPDHPGMAFPDRKGQDNIRWCSGPRAAKARAGGFTLDRALAGRRQAAVQLLGDSIQLTPLHPRCPTYVVRLRDGSMEHARSLLTMSIGDMVVAGTTVIGVRAPE